MKLAVTVDLENDLGFLPSRYGIEEGMPLLLALLEIHGVSATFFVSGDSLAALRDTGLVGELDRCGHEIASHGYRHADYRAWGYQDLYREVRRSKDELEDLLGREVKGYRAPQFLMNGACLRAIKEAGFRYDSSCVDPGGLSAARLLRGVRPERDWQGQESGRSCAGQQPQIAGYGARQGSEPDPHGAWAGLREFRIDSIPLLRVPHGLLWVNAITFACYRRLFPRLDQELATFYLHPFDLIRGKGRVPLDLKRRLFYLNRGDTASRLFEGLLGFWKQRGLEFVRLGDQLTQREVVS